jgi:hypothetical protein
LNDTIGESAPSLGRIASAPAAGCVGGSDSIIHPCGRSGFTAAEQSGSLVSVTREPRQRILASLGFGLAMGLIALQAAWIGAGMAYLGHGPPLSTWFRMQRLADGVRDYQRGNHAVPADLAELERWERSEPGPHPRSGVSDGRCTDAWDHPMVYQRDADAFTITSLGADGLTGGTGIDIDMVLRPDSPEKLEAVPSDQKPHITFWQFISGRIRSTRIMHTWSGICAAAGALLCFFLLRPLPESGPPLATRSRAWTTRPPARPSAETRSLDGVIMVCLITLVFAALYAAFIGMADIVKWH